MPGNEIVRLLQFAAVDGSGKPSSTLDIRDAFRVQLDYSVLEGGHVLVPNFHFFNEEGICVFVLHDTDPDWRRRRRPAGIYRSLVQIPGNFLSEGTLFVGAAVSTYDPFRVHVYERDAIAFRVIDTLAGETARGDYVGHMPGVVRPMLPWTTTRNAESPTP